MNTVTLSGRLTADPQSRSAGDMQICDLRLAVPRRKGREGEDRGAVFVDITAFGGQATACGKYLSKGSRVGVQGRLELDEWQAQDGSPRRRHKIVAEQVEFLDPAPSKTEEPADEVAAKREQRDQTGDAEQAA